MGFYNFKIGIYKFLVIIIKFKITKIGFKTEINVLRHQILLFQNPSYCASSVFVIQSQFSLVGEAPNLLEHLLRRWLRVPSNTKRVIPVTRYHSNIVIE